VYVVYFYTLDRISQAQAKVLRTAQATRPHLIIIIIVIIIIIIIIFSGFAEEAGEL
jgi:hypothetical protein